MHQIHFSHSALLKDSREDIYEIEILGLGLTGIWGDGAKGPQGAFVVVCGFR